MSKQKPNRKWCLPATCSMCKRTCTHFWGECADIWSCDGHYDIFETNSDTHGFRYYPEYQAISKKMEEYPEPPYTDEQKEEIKATDEYKDWYEGPIYKKWIERRKRGVQWLKDNPEPSDYPTCSMCKEEAQCHEKEVFFCMEHWPVKDE